MADEKTVTYLEALKRLTTADFSVEEQTRLKAALQDQSSRPSKVLWENLERSVHWNSFCTEQKIKGFQQGSATKGKRDALKIVVAADLSKGKPTRNQWRLYFNICFEFILKNYATLADQIEEELHIPEGSDVSHILVKGLCENAEAGKFYRSNIRDIYELFPFRRLDDIEELLSSAPEMGVMDQVDQKIAELEEELKAVSEELSGKMRSVLDEIREVKTATKAESDEFKRMLSEMEALAASKHEHIAKSMKNEVLSEVELQIKESSENATIGREMALLEYREAVARVDAEIQALADDVQLKLLSAEDRVTPTTTHLAGVFDQTSIWNRHKNLSSSQASSAFEHLSEEEFLKIFAANAAVSGLRYSYEDLELFHKAVLGLPIVVMSDADLMRCWINSLGWGPFHTQVCASPLWSDPTIWVQAQEELFSAGVSPQIVSILDFDQGLVSCYLDPLLKVWLNTDLGEATTKLFLIASNSLSRERPSLLTVPAVHIDRYGATQQPNLEKLPDAQLEKRVKKEDFQGWCAVPPPIREGALRSALAVELESKDRVLPSSLVKAANVLLSNLSEVRGGSESEKICQRMLIEPWLERTLDA